MAKKLYRIPVEWAVTGTMLVEAESLAEALIEAEESFARSTRLHRRHF